MIFEIKQLCGVHFSAILFVEVRMAVPKKRTSLLKRRQRRTHYIAKVRAQGKCPECAKPVLNYCVCNHCGFYNKRSYAGVINVRG